MRTAKLMTMGCKVNQYDTQSMRETLRRNGYTVIDNETSQQETDLYLINTCTVTNTADQKARQVIRRAIRKHPNAKVLVTGCYAESDREAIEEIPGVTFVFGNREKADFQQYLDVLHTETASEARLETLASSSTPHIQSAPCDRKNLSSTMRFANTHALAKVLATLANARARLSRCKTDAVLSVPTALSLMCAVE